MATLINSSKYGSILLYVGYTEKNWKASIIE